MRARRETAALRSVASAITATIVLFALNLAALAAPEKLSPRWICDVPTEIEWLRIIEIGGQSFLLICDKENFISIHDLRDSDVARDPLTPDWPRANSAVKFAACSHDILYLYDFTDIFAARIDLPSNTQSLRCTPLWIQPISIEPPTNADPEFLLRVVAAEPLLDGLFVLRSDGAAALIRGTDGEITHHWSFPPTTLCESHSDGNLVALWCKHERGLRGAFLDPAKLGERVSFNDFDLPPPIHSELRASGLVLVWTDRFGLVRNRYGSKIQPFPEGSRVTANLACAMENDAIADPRRPRAPMTCLFIPAADECLWAFSFRDLKELFEPASPPADKPLSFLPRKLHESGGYLLLESWTEQLVVYRPQNPKPWFTLRRLSAVLRGASVQDGVLYALYADNTESPDSQPIVHRAPWRLARVVLSIPATQPAAPAQSTTQSPSPAPSRGARPTRDPKPAGNADPPRGAKPTPSVVPPQDAEPAPPTGIVWYDVDAAPGAQFLWTERALLIIENNRIWSYTLP